MPISIEMPGGAVVEFPDGTDADTIQRVLGGQQPQTGSEIKETPMGGWEAAGRGAVAGAMFEFDDEAYGVGKGLYNLARGKRFDEGYAEGAESVRAQKQRALKDAPWSYRGGQVAGAVAVPLGGAGVARLAGASVMAPAAAATSRALGVTSNLGQSMVRSGLSGTLAGGTFAAGAADPNARAEMGEAMQGRALAAVPGALVGGAVGTAMPPLIQAGQAAVKGLTQGVRGYMAPQRMARQKFGEALARDLDPNFAEGVQPGPSLANKQVAKSIQLSRGNQEYARQAGRQAADDGPMMIADVGGENTRNLIRSAGNMPSRNAQIMKQRLDARQAASPARLNRAANEAMRTADGGLWPPPAQQRGYYDTIERLTETANARSSPYYQRAFNQRIVGPTDQLDEILQRPWMQRAREIAEDMMRNEGIDPSRVQPVEMLHRVKMALDSAIGKSRRGIQDSKANWDTRSLVRLKNQFVRAIDDISPDYARARGIYAGDAALRNAAEDGFENALKEAPEVLARRLARLDPSERQAFQVGAIQALRDKINRGPALNDRVKPIFSSPDMQERLRVLMPDRTARREFQRTLVQEAKMGATRAAMQGNSTTAKQLMSLQEAGQPVEAITAAGHAATGRFGQVLNWASRQASKLQGISPATANEILRMAMQTNGREARRAVQAAINASTRNQRTREELSRIVRQATIAITQGKDAPADR